MALRAIPNTVTIRPADANETAQAWVYALKRKDGPTAFALSRQNLPNLDIPKGAVKRVGISLAIVKANPMSF